MHSFDLYNHPTTMLNEPPVHCTIENGENDDCFFKWIANIMVSLRHFLLPASNDIYNKISK